MAYGQQVCYESVNHVVGTMVLWVIVANKQEYITRTCVFIKLSGLWLHNLWLVI